MERALQKFHHGSCETKGPLKKALTCFSDVAFNRSRQSLNPQAYRQNGITMEKGLKNANDGNWI